MMRTTIGTRTVGGTLLAATGALLLLWQIVNVSGDGASWPFFVILPGVLCLAIALFGGRIASLLAVPGSVTATAGLILLWQAGTGYYQSWAYVWMLLIAAAGAGLAAQGLATGRPRLAGIGMGIAGAGLILCVIAGLAYELVIKNVAPVVSVPWPHPGIAWPYYVVAAGVLLTAGMAIDDERAALLAVPGSVVTTIGLILLYQDATASYLSWTYAWALIPAAAGLGLIAQGARSGQKRLVRIGVGIAEVSAIVFLLFATFFDAVLGFGTIDDGVAGKALWPLLLIAAGAIALFRHSPRASDV